MNGVNIQRYNTTTRIRHNCASILGVSETDLLQPEVRKTTFREEIGWVKDSGQYSSIDVPILHKDWGGEYSLSSVFLNPKLMGVSCNASYINYWNADPLSLPRSMSLWSEDPKLVNTSWMATYYIHKMRQWLGFITSTTSHLVPSLHVVYWYVICHTSSCIDIYLYCLSGPLGTFCRWISPGSRIKYWHSLF